MHDFRALSASRQLAAHLKDEIIRGIWSGTMPGEERLMAKLGVGQATVRAALRQLEEEGFLESRGQGRRRRIVLPEKISPPSLRVRILLFEKSDSECHYIVDLQHRLMEAGHAASFASKTLTDLGQDLQRVVRYVQQTPADAWVVFAGPRKVLEWFSRQPIPAYALAGRRRGVRIASIGPDKLPALRDAVSRLVALGHRRIVMLAREMRLNPVPGKFEQCFLEALEANGILSGDYNLPRWEDSREGLHQCLASLFRHTPPTALIIAEMPLFIAAQQHLAQRGIIAPRDVSLICDDPNPAFSWCLPTVAHIHWDSSQWPIRIVRWANNLSRGKDDRRQGFTKAVFVEGGTMGPAPGKTTA